VLELPVPLIVVHLHYSPPSVIAAGGSRRMHKGTGCRLHDASAASRRRLASEALHSLKRARSLRFDRPRVVH
jgi:hypothetical protein